MCSSLISYGSIVAKLTYFVTPELHHFPQKPQPRKIPKFHNFWFEFLKPVRYLLQSLFWHNSSIQSTSADHIRWVYLVFLVRGKEMEDVLVDLLSIPTSILHFSSRSCECSHWSCEFALRQRHSIVTEFSMSSGIATMENPSSFWAFALCNWHKILSFSLCLDLIFKEKSTRSPVLQAQVETELSYLI